MRIGLLKILLLHLTSAAFLASTAFPCNCLAQKSSSEKNKTPVAHDCCDEETPYHDRGCNDCADCIRGASCSVDYMSMVYQKNTVESEDAAKFISTVPVFLLTSTSTCEVIVGSGGPPGVEVVSSATLPVFLQRWLI